MEVYIEAFRPKDKNDWFMEDIKKPSHRVAESFEHKMMKQYFYENLKSVNSIKKMELEYIVESR